MTRTLSARKRIILSVLGLGLVAGPLAACSSDSDQASAPKAVAVIETLSGQSTSIKLDGGFVEALTSLELTPGVTGSAKLVDGSLVFPISGGNVSVFTPGEVSPYVIGQVQHEGSGLTLTAGDTTVELSNFNVDPGVSRVYGDVSVNGKSVVNSAFLFQLDGRTLEPLTTKGNTATLQGTRVEISTVAAPLLNDTFGTKAVKPGLLVGIATIKVNIK